MKIKIECRWFTRVIVHDHAPTKDKEGAIRNTVYDRLDVVYDLILTK